MPVSSPLRFLPYAAVLAVLLLVGLNSLHGGGGSDSQQTFPDGAGNASAASPDSGLKIGSAGDTLVIDVAGGVRRPGVYQLAAGSRVIDAIRKAGGTTRRAMPGSINRAAKLADGQQVVMPEVVLASGAQGAAAGGLFAGASSGSATASSTTSSTGGPTVPISLSSATVEQLDQIEGIGPVTAQNIIEFRDSKGGLASIDQVDEVSGIGPVTMEALRSSLQP